MLDVKEIQEIIPHRFPMLLVDRIIEIKEKEKIVGIKNVTINEQFFQGHYPQEPIMPGVLIIEALAQVGAVGILSLEEFKGKTPYFGGINKAKFRRKVVPGDTLTLEVEFVKLRSRAGVGYGRAYVDNEIAAEGEIMFFIG